VTNDHLYRRIFCISGVGPSGSINIIVYHVPSGSVQPGKGFMGSKWVHIYNIRKFPDQLNPDSTHGLGKWTVGTI
jgi:hypothetical protein